MAVLTLLIAALLGSSAAAARNPEKEVMEVDDDIDGTLAKAEDPCAIVPRCAEDTTKPIFFDMVHSNNAARVRLFLRLYVGDKVPICMVTYADMRCEWFKKINPNQKVPAIIIPTGAGDQKEVLLESNVIYEYIVETNPISSADSNVPFKHQELDAMHRAKVNLMCRVHDLYVASPNCNQPGCTHSQGALYLPPPGEFDPTGGRRAIDSLTRSRKIAELWTRWTWLEDYSQALGNHKYLAGDFLSMADTTWFPTAVFMEFLLKHVAEWPTLFADYDAATQTTQDFVAPSHWGGWVVKEKWNPGPVAGGMLTRFPKLTAWYPELLKIPEFRTVRGEIMGFWLNERHLDSVGQEGRISRFDPIKEAIKASSQLPWKPVRKTAGMGWPA